MLALVVTDPDTFRTGGMSGYRFHALGVGVLVVAQIRWMALLTSRVFSRTRPSVLPLARVRPSRRPLSGLSVRAISGCARYLATMSAGTWPRTLMSMPCSRAQVRTATVSTVLGLRPPRALPLRVVLPTLRAWVTYFPKIWSHRY